MTKTRWTWAMSKQNTSVYLIMYYGRVKFEAYSQEDAEWLCNRLDLGLPPSEEI